MNTRKNSRALEDYLKKFGLLLHPAAEEVVFTGISNNSKEAAAGDLFICKGYGFKPEYLQMAEEHGAVCYMAEQEICGTDLPFLCVSDVRKAQSLAARWFYDFPSETFQLIGITGTKGKTTTTYMMHTVMDAVAGQKTGLVSGMERDVGNGVFPSHLTTPESLDLQHYYAEARNNHLPVVTTEISSQAYKVHRVYGQHFQYGVFLNIGPDHISPHEHPDMEDYLRCKIALLENSDTAVICRDTDYFEKIYQSAAAKCRRVVLVGDSDDCDFRYHDVSKRPSGYHFLVTEKDTGETYPYSIAMDGVFNIKNAMCAIAVGRMMGGSSAKINSALEDFVVPGRSDVYTDAGLTIFINHMHNGISCEAVLGSIHEDYPDSYLTVLIGVAGERSPQRIRDVGRICGTYADRVYFTAQNPGREDPRELSMRLAKAAEGTKAEVIVEPDRVKAVERALLDAPDGSLVVLGGKGTDNTQCVNGKYVAYESDPAIMRRILPLRKKMHHCN